MTSPQQKEEEVAGYSYAFMVVNNVLAGARDKTLEEDKPYIERLVNEDPKNPALQLWLAATMQAMGDAQSALPHFKAAISCMSVLSNNKHVGQLFEYYAQCAEASGDKTLMRKSNAAAVQAYCHPLNCFKPIEGQISPLKL